ncbi:Uncharacterised protein [Mycobacteroides abscessus subsp. abscessus]|nr:Uncharacterised protein [Mycobacteroides abscessus subsp. abscessus]
MKAKTAAALATLIQTAQALWVCHHISIPSAVSDGDAMSADTRTVVCDIAAAATPI